MKTQLLYLTLAFSIIASGLAAQQTEMTSIHQVGINFSSLNSFGLHYKTGSEKTLLRLSLLAINLGSSSAWGKQEDSIDIKTQNMGVGFRIGFERHVPIVAKLDFIWGIDAGSNFQYQKMKNHQLYSTDYESSSWSVTPLVYFVLGATYTIADHLVFGAEIGPGVQYSYGKTKFTANGKNSEETLSNFNFGFNSNSASLSLAYRFGK